MRRPRFAAVLLTALLALLVVAPAAGADDSSFGQFVKQLERDYNIRRTHIPLFWLAKGVVRVASPAGVSRLDLAVFEDQDLTSLTGAPDLPARVHRLLGEGWKPFVEVYAPRSGERTFLYAREKGAHLELFIFTVENNEAVALLTRVNPEAFRRAVDDPPSFLSGLR